jgi:hypothetical protein
MQLPAWQQPPPILLLVSWLILALAIIAYFETHLKTRNLKVFLIGSAFIAFSLGVLEDSSVRSIILTNLPWCLTSQLFLGILMNSIVHCIPGVRLQQPSQLDIFAKRQDPSDVEKLNF